MNNQTINIIPASQLIAVRQAREREALRVRQALIMEINALISKWNPLDGPLELPFSKFYSLDDDLCAAGYATSGSSEENFMRLTIKSLKTSGCGNCNN